MSYGKWRNRRKNNVIKQIVYFCAEYDNQDVIPQDDEIAGIALATYEEALQMFKFESSKCILKEAHIFLLNR